MAKVESDRRGRNCAFPDHFFRNFPASNSEPHFIKNLPLGVLCVTLKLLNDWSGSDVQLAGGYFSSFSTPSLTKLMKIYLQIYFSLAKRLSLIVLCKHLTSKELLRARTHGQKGTQILQINVPRVMILSQNFGKFI